MPFSSPVAFTHTKLVTLLTNFVIHPLCFLTAYKSYDVLPVLAGTSDSKNADPYYLTRVTYFSYVLLNGVSITYYGYDIFCHSFRHPVTTLVTASNNPDKLTNNFILKSFDNKQSINLNL